MLLGPSNFDVFRNAALVNWEGHPGRYISTPSLVFIHQVRRRIGRSG